jgi:hypothetical protein
MYWHVSRWSGSELWIGGLTTKVLRARVVSTGQEMKLRQTFEPTERLHLYDLPAMPPDPQMTVIALECDGPPRHRLGAGCVWVDGVP